MKLQTRSAATALLTSVLFAGLLPATALAAAGPTATDDDAVVPVNAGATTINVLANDTGAGLTIQAAGSAGHGTVNVAGDARSLTYAPTAGFHGLDTFDYTVTDGALTDVGTVNVAVDTAPVAVDDGNSVCSPSDGEPFGGAFPVPEDWVGPVAPTDYLVLICPLTLNDTDVDGDPLTWTILTQPSHGTAMQIDQWPAYRPDPNFSTKPGDQPGGQWISDSFTYRAWDGFAWSQPAAMRYWVAPVNDVPTFTPGADVTVNEDSGPYSATWATNISPGPNESDQTVSFLPDGPAGLNDPNHLFATAPAIDSSGVLTFTLNPDANGHASVSWVAKDDGGVVDYTQGSATPKPRDTSDQFTFGIDVTPDDVDAVDDMTTLPEDSNPGPWLIDALGNDTFPAGSTITAITQGGLGDVAITPDGLSLTYAPHADANGSDSFTYTLDDGAGSTDTATVAVAVTSVNDAPDGADKTVGTTVDAPYVFAANDFGFSDAHDTPPDSLSAVTITSLPAAGVLDDDGTPVLAGDSVPVADITGGDLSFTPGAGEHGVGYASFTFQVQDDGGTANGGTDLDATPNTMTIDVTLPNHAPVAVADGLTISRNASATAVNVLSNDSDADLDTLTITAKTNGAKGTVVITGGGTGLTYQPATNATGSDSFTYTISDGHGGTATGTVSVTINNTNSAPAAGDDSRTLLEDASATAIAVLTNDTDAEHDPLTITGKTNGAKGIVVITGGGTGLTYQPNANANGTDSFTYTISDGHGGSDTATVSMTITPVNDLPKAVPDSITMAEDALATAIPVLSNDSDADGDARTITGKTDGAKGVVVITGSGTGLTYKPNANATGSDTFTYTISDGHSGSATGTVTVTLTPVNDPPNAVNDAGLTVPESAGATALAVKANDTDVDHDTLTITAKTNGAHGTVAITGGGTGLSYDPAQLYYGNDVFSYTISDGHGATDTATVLVTVVKDTVKPKVVAPAESFYNQVVGTTTTREKISWSGSDTGGTGIVKYQLQVSVNGGSYSTVTLSSATATSVNRTLTTNSSYRFRVRATDRQGNVSAYVYGPTFKPVRIQNTSSSVVYTGSWTTTSNSQALGGSHRYSSSTSARARYTASMRDVAWIATKTTASGSAQVWIDGTLAATINLRVSSNAYHRLIFHRHFTSLGTHTIEIRPIGGGRVYLDAFTVDR